MSTRPTDPAAAPTPTTASATSAGSVGETGLRSPERAAAVSALLDDIARRRTPAAGGISPALLRLEVLRVLRNRRTMIFTLVMPVAFFYMFGTNSDYADEKYGVGNVSAMIMIGMALYGALIATAGAGAAVSTERAAGWSRQLRLTPLSSVGYITAKALSGLVIGAVAVLAVYLAASFSKPRMPLETWVETGLVVWIGSLVFVAFGLFVGYLLPTDNAMQFVGPLMALLAFLGGLWMPLPDSGWLHDLSVCSPMYGLHQLALAPMRAGTFEWTAVVNVVAWLAIFLGGAAWRMSRDIKRV